MVLRECTGASPGGPGDLSRAGGHWAISGNCPVRWSARAAGRWQSSPSALLRRRRRSSRRGEASAVQLRLGRRPAPRRSQGLRGGASGQSRQSAGGGRDRVSEEGRKADWGEAWYGWYRHITLSMLAHAYLAVVRHQDLKQDEKRAATI